MTQTCERCGKPRGFSHICITGFNVAEFEARHDQLQAETRGALANFNAVTPPHCAKHPRYSVVPFCPDCRNEEEQVRRKQQELRGGIEAAALGVPLNGGKLAGDHYYRVTVTEPMSPELQACTVECGDIIEALNMTFNEGEAFKAIWRLAAQRQGRGKPGNRPQYDADKAAHYGARIAAQTKKAGAA